MLMATAELSCVSPNPDGEGSNSPYVILEFTVTKEGRVENPRIVESSDAKFDDAAIEAVSKWKYKPRAQPKEGVKVRLEFDR